MGSLRGILNETWHLNVHFMFFNLFVLSMFMKDNFKLLGCKFYAQLQEKSLCLQMRREPRAHTMVFINGVGFYKCIPWKGCEKHQQLFQAHSMPVLFRKFCKGHPAIAPVVTEYIYRKIMAGFTNKIQHCTQEFAQYQSDFNERFILVEAAGMRSWTCAQC